MRASDVYLHELTKAVTESRAKAQAEQERQREANRARARSQTPVRLVGGCLLYRIFSTSRCAQ